MKTKAEPGPLHESLISQPGGLEALVKQAQTVQSINELVRRWHDQSWATSLRVANFRSGTLVIFADNAATLTTLRFKSDLLIEFLNKEHGLTVERIEAKVRPQASSPSG